MTYKLTNKSNLTHEFPGGITVEPGENVFEALPADVLATIRETYVATGQMELEGSGPVALPVDASAPVDVAAARELAEARAKLEADQAALVKAATEEVERLEKAQAELDDQGAKLQAEREAFELERKAFEETKANAAALAAEATKPDASPAPDATPVATPAPEDKPADASTDDGA